MALTFSRPVANLDKGFVLLPERYHPGRLSAVENGKLLSEIVFESRKTISSSQKELDNNMDVVVLDTSEAYNGFLDTNKSPVSTSELKSVKKLVQPGDVLISRLRPYLRQVAYVESSIMPSSPLVASTEYLILRPRNKDESISFLVPFLLSKDIQHILSLSVEGAHHPRFKIDTLFQLRVPEYIYKNRERLSATVSKNIISHYNAVKKMSDLTLGMDPPSTLEPVD